MRLRGAVLVRVGILMSELSTARSRVRMSEADVKHVARLISLYGPNVRNLKQLEMHKDSLRRAREDLARLEK